MKLEEIVKELEYIKEGYFPKKAIKEAVKNKEKITPLLLESLENVVKNPEKYTNKPEFFLHIYSLFLLAEFREKRAFPIILKLIRIDFDALDFLLGDLITEELKNR